jgi:hypothetical protein
MLAGTPPEKSYDGLDVRNFQEKRDRELSLDRLGRTNVEKPVVRYLLPRAKHSGGKMRPTRAFHGWAVIKVEHLVSATTSMPVSPSPIAGESEEDVEANLYHAHALLPDDLKLDPTASLKHALYLRYLFVNKGFVERAPIETSTITDRTKRLILAGISRLARLLTRQPPTAG